MRLLLILLNFSLVAWAASDVPDGAAGAGASVSRPVGAPASATEGGTCIVAGTVGALPTDQRNLLEMVGSFTVSAERQSQATINTFQENRSALKAFNVEAWNEVYYIQLVEGVSSAIAWHAHSIANPLRAVARTENSILRAALAHFQGLKSTLDMLAQLYLESAFTPKETDTDDIRRAHSGILHTIETGYFGLHSVIFSLYGTEGNALRKELLVQTCAYNERACQTEERVCEESELDKHKYERAVMISQLYQVPPYDRRTEHRGTLMQIKRSFREKPNYSIGIDALLTALEELDIIHETDTDFADALRLGRDERYREIYLVRGQEAKARLTTVMEIVNGVMGNPGRKATLIAQVGVLNAQLKLHAPSLISRRPLAVSAPHAKDLEGMELLRKLEETFKDLVQEERTDGAVATADAGSGAAAMGGVSLLDAYRRYSQYFPYYRPQIIENAFLLIRNEQFEYALERLRILKIIESERGREVANMITWTEALCRGYMGDWGPYNALRTARDAALEAERTAKGAKRDAAAASARESAIVQIRAAQEAAAAKKIEADSARAAAEASRTARLRAPVEPGTGVGMSPAERMEEAEIARMHDADRKAAAIDRAAARAAAKTLEADMPAVAVAAGVGAGAGASSPPFAAAGAGAAAGASGGDIDVDLTSLFGLKGTARTVEAEITGNTWKITRKDLITYFTNLGCTIRQTKGSHKMVELPDVTEILVDDQVIAVIPDEGGAGTLPGWDGNHFPPYLIPQMRTLRSILAVSAANAVARSAVAEEARIKAEEDLFADEAGAAGGKGSKGKGKGKKGSR